MSTSHNKNIHIIDTFSPDEMPSHLIVRRNDDDHTIIVPATTQTGYAIYGIRKEGYPKENLNITFLCEIDNNTYDDRNIIILDIYDLAHDTVVAKKLLTRKNFPHANTPYSIDFPLLYHKNMIIEPRIFYMGYATIKLYPITISANTESRSFIQTHPSSY